MPSDLSLAVQGIVAVLLIAGFWNIRRGRVDNHRRLMTTAVGLGLLSTLGVMVPSIMSGLPSDPGPFASRLLPIARPGHAAVGTLTLLSGLYLVVVMRNYPQPRRGRIRRFKRLMQATIVVWIATTAGGAALYLLSYVA